MSASTIVRNGPGRSRDRSRTTMPSRASATGPRTPRRSIIVPPPRRPRRLALGELEQLLQLHREHRIAGDDQLALEVQLHARVGIAEHGLEVVVRDLDRALRLAAV